MKLDLKTEAPTHFVFAVLFFTTGFYGDHIASVFPGWRDPKIGILCVVIGLLWLLRFFVGRYKEMADELKVLRDRVERTERHVNALEDEQRRM